MLYGAQKVGIGLTKGVCMYEQQKICRHACYMVCLLITRVRTFNGEALNILIREIAIKVIPKACTNYMTVLTL